MSSDGRRTVHTKAGLRARQPTQTGEHMSISYLPVSNTNVPGRQPIAQLEATFTAKLAELRAHADQQRFAWALDIDGRYSGPTPSALLLK
jgi:hypothetical protein